MAYRGFFTLDGVEIANTSRIVDNFDPDMLSSDVALFGLDQLNLVEDPPGSGLYLPTTTPDGDGLYPVAVAPDADGLFLLTACALVEDPAHPNLYFLPDSSVEVQVGLWSPPDGARRYGPGLMLVDGSCVAVAVASCQTCDTTVEYDDSWDGLRNFLGDTEYRLEFAPWYSTQLPESAEYAGMWMTAVDGFGPVPIERPITETAGDGAIAGRQRNRSRTITFEATMLACTNAGLEFGLDWLTCLLRATGTTGGVLRYFDASPAYSAADPGSLLREMHGVVLTQEPRVTQSFAPSSRPNDHATMYQITWEMVALSPYAYLPAVDVPVEWDDIVRQPVNWIHAPDCVKPETCVEMPVLFSADCIPEEIEVVASPPPVCGGCLPVGEIDKYSFRVPTMNYAFRCRETAVTTIIRNDGDLPLTLQAFWRICGTDIRCEDNRYPVQITGLPPAAELVLDGITGRFWVNYDGRVRRPVGIVGTPTGAPWLPPVIDRETCWDFIVQTSGSSEFSVALTLADREP